MYAQSKSKAKVSSPQLRRTSSFDRTWEENVAESVANELVLQAHSSSSKGGSLGFIDDKSKDTAGKGGTDDKTGRPRKLREFHNIKISQVSSLHLSTTSISF